MKGAVRRADPARAPWNGTLVRSRFFDAISLLLPAAERFLIETLEEWLSRAGDSVDSRLGAEVERFLREERAHQSVHLRYNDSLIATDPAAQEPALRASRATDDIRGLDLATRMALAAAFEILTSLLSRELLERPYLLGSGESAEARIWRWHAREELAHCHVVFWRALCRCDIRAGARRARMWADGLSFALHSVPSLLRMSAGWTRQLVR